MLMVNAQLKENSLGNIFLKSLLTGIAEGLKQSAIHSIHSLSSSLISGNNRSHNAESNKGEIHSGADAVSSSSSGSNSENSGGLSANVQARIRQVERNLANEEEYLKKAQERYVQNPSASGKASIEAHKRAIQGYKKQLVDLRK